MLGNGLGHAGKQGAKWKRAAAGEGDGAAKVLPWHDWAGKTGKGVGGAEMAEE